MSARARLARLRRLVATVAAVLLLHAPGTRAAGPRDEVRCAVRAVPTSDGRGFFASPAAPSPRGPCQAADGVAILPALAGGAPVLLTNFGLLVPQPARIADAAADAGAPARYGVVCEESFGGRVPARLARHADGRLFLPAPTGIFVAAADAVPACGFDRPAGSVAGAPIVDVAFDASDPRRVYALATGPATLHASSDGGVTFAAVATLPTDANFTRVLVDAGAAVYVAGDAPARPLVLGRSSDGGASFGFELLGPERFAGPGSLVVVEGASPVTPDLLFATVGDARGSDGIWRSPDAGKTWTRTLALPGTETRVGFTFGPAPGELVVAGRELVASAGAGTHLFTSRDEGATFEPARATAVRLRCLGAGEGRLWGCGDFRDGFLFGVSSDEGGSWTPLATITDIAGPRPCSRDRCAATAFWLCMSYGICEDQPFGRPDGSTVEGDARSADVVDVQGETGDTGAGGSGVRGASSGCGCHLGGGPPDHGGGALATLATVTLLQLLWVARHRRVARRRPS